MLEQTVMVPVGLGPFNAADPGAEDRDATGRGPEVRPGVAESLLAQYGVASATALHAPVFARSSRRVARGRCHLFPVLPTVLAFLPVGAAIGT
jgi:hypothetical protein